jgi:hypothetical protein
MFNTGGTSAYGRGITSNLVSDEQRQRFNYGGRVGYQNRGYVNIRNLPEASGGVYKIPGMPYDRIPVGYDYIGGDPVRDYKMVGDWYIDEQGNRVYDEEKTDFIPWKEKIGTDDVRTRSQFDEIQTKQYNAAQRAKKRKEAELGIDPTPDSGRVFDDTAGDWRKNIDIPGVVQKEKEIVEEPGYETGEHWEDLASKMPVEVLSKKETTDVLEVDPFAFLDENIEKKRKIARGYGAMEAAAAAIDWSTAGTAKEKSAAISGGLRKVGAIGAKYKGEAEDIKTKAKILGTIEDIKGGYKLEEWEKKLSQYYKPSLEQAEHAQEWKEGQALIANARAKDKTGKEIYSDILRPDEIKTAEQHQTLIEELTGITLTLEDDDNSKELRSPEKDGLIFIDKLGRIKKNHNGEIKSHNPRTDPFFKWKD